MTARLSKLAGELRRRPRAFWLFVGAAALLVAATLLLFAAAPEPRRVAAAGEQATAAPVRALALRPRPMQRETRSSGVVEPRRRVSLLSETRGRVLRVGAAELDSVAEGQLLLQVDPLLAEVAVERGRAAVARAESQLALARDARTRFQRLAERDVASAARLDQAVNDARVAEANLREARANLSEARSQLRKKKLRAPFAGVLQRFPVEAGEFLREGDLAAELLDLETVRIELGVSDREVVALKVGQPVRAELDAYPGEIFEAEVLRVGAAFAGCGTAQRCALGQRRGWKRWWNRKRPAPHSARPSRRAPPPPPRGAGAREPARVRRPPGRAGEHSLRGSDRGGAVRIFAGSRRGLSRYFL